MYKLHTVIYAKVRGIVIKSQNTFVLNLPCWNMFGATRQLVMKEKKSNSVI